MCFIYSICTMYFSLINPASADARIHLSVNFSTIFMQVAPITALLHNPSEPLFF